MRVSGIATRLSCTFAPVSTALMDELLSQDVFDHACMHALHQHTTGKLFKGTTEGGLAGQCKTQIKAAQSTQFAVSLQTIYQCAAIHLRLAYPTTLCVEVARFV